MTEQNIAEYAVEKVKFGNVLNTQKLVQPKK